MGTCIGSSSLVSLRIVIYDNLRNLGEDNLLQICFKWWFAAVPLLHPTFLRYSNIFVSWFFEFQILLAAFFFLLPVCCVTTSNYITWDVGEPILSVYLLNFGFHIFMSSKNSSSNFLLLVDWRRISKLWISCSIWWKSSFHGPSCFRTYFC